MIYSMGTVIFISFYPHILMALYSTSLGPPPLALTTYTRAEILKKIARLEDNEQYTKVLTLGRQEVDEEVQATKDENERAGNELKVLTVVPNDHIKGKILSEHNYYSGVDTTCNQLYGLADIRDHARLMQYASENGPFSVKQVQLRGTCMFALMRRCINCSFEWTNTHLCRQVAAHIIHNVEFLYPIISTHIQGNYDHLRLSDDAYKNKKRLGILTQEDKDDYEAQDPFNLVTYLKALIKKKFYGDEIVLIVISMMWQVHISIWNAETLRQIKIRTFNNTLSIQLLCPIR